MCLGGDLESNHDSQDEAEDWERCCIVCVDVGVYGNTAMEGGNAKKQST